MYFIVFFFLKFHQGWEQLESNTVVAHIEDRLTLPDLSSILPEDLASLGNHSALGSLPSFENVVSVSTSLCISFYFNLYSYPP